MKNCNYHIWYLTSRPASSIQVNPADWITWGQDMNFGEETLQRLFLRNILRRFSNYWSERRNRHWRVNKLRVKSYHLLGGLTWSLYFIRNWGQIVTFLGESYHFVGLTWSLIEGLQIVITLLASPHLCISQRLGLGRGHNMTPPWHIFWFEGLPHMEEGMRL